MTFVHQTIGNINYYDPVLQPVYEETCGDPNSYDLVKDDFSNSLESPLSSYSEIGISRAFTRYLAGGAKCHETSFRSQITRQMKNVYSSPLAEERSVLWNIIMNRHTTLSIEIFDLLPKIIEELDNTNEWNEQSEDLHYFALQGHRAEILFEQIEILRTKIREFIQDNPGQNSLLKTHNIRDILISTEIALLRDLRLGLSDVRNVISDIRRNKSSMARSIVRLRDSRKQLIKALDKLGSPFYLLYLLQREFPPDIRASLPETKSPEQPSKPKTFSIEMGIPDEYSIIRPQNPRILRRILEELVIYFSQMASETRPLKMEFIWDNVDNELFMSIHNLYQWELGEKAGWKGLKELIDDLVTKLGEGAHWTHRLDKIGKMGAARLFLKIPLEEEPGTSHNGGNGGKTPIHLGWPTPKPGSLASPAAGNVNRFIEIEMQRYVATMGGGGNMSHGPFFNRVPYFLPNNSISYLEASQLFPNTLTNVWRMNSMRNFSFAARTSF